MSLPTMRELLVDLKDLGEYVQDVKGVFSFVTTEKPGMSFEQQWVEAFKNNDFVLSKEEQELLAYPEEAEQKVEQGGAEEINKLLEQNPTEAGVESNYFRLGVEGVYRIMAKHNADTQGVVSGSLYNKNTFHGFNDLTFEKAQYVPVLEKMGLENFGNVALDALNAVLDIANASPGANNIVDANANVGMSDLLFADVEDVPVATPLFGVLTQNPGENLPLGHRNEHPQQVMLDAAVSTAAPEVAPAEVVDEATVEALLADFDVDVAEDDVAEAVEAPVVEAKAADAEVVVTKAVDTPATSSSNEEVNQTLVNELLADMSAQDELAAAGIKIEEAVDMPAVVQADEPSLVPAIDDNLTEVVGEEARDEEVDQVLVNDLLGDMSTQDELAAAGIKIEEAVDMPAVVQENVRSDLTEVVREVATADVASNEEVDQALVDDLLADMAVEGPSVAAEETPPEVPARDDKDVSSDDAPPAIPARDDDVIEQQVADETPVAAVLPPPPPPLPPANWKPTKASEAAPKVDTVAVEKVLEDFNSVDVAASDKADVVDVDMLNELLNLGSDVPPTPGAVPPPPPPPAGKMKANAAIEGTQSAPQEAAPKAKINVGKPEFTITGDDFADQWAKMKAKAAEKALTEAPVIEVRKESSALVDVFAKAMSERQSSIKFEIDKDQSSSDSDSSWDDEFTVKEKNLDLIQQKIREKSAHFDTNTLVDAALEAKETAISQMVDAYEQKLNTLPLIAKLSAQDKENNILVNGINHACTQIQRKITAHATTHASHGIKHKLEEILHAKLMHDLKVNSLTTELTAQTIDNAINGILANGETGNELKATAQQYVAESLDITNQYLTHGTVPEGHLKAGIDALVAGFNVDKAALINIVSDQKLHIETEVVAKPAEQPTGGGFGDFLVQMLGGRRKAIEGDDNTDEHQTEAKETKPVIESSPFGIEALKSLIGGKLGAAKTTDSEITDSHSEADVGVVDDALALFSPVNSGYLSDAGKSDSVADLAKVDAAMALLSPASSSVLSTEPIQMADVLASGSDAGVHNDPTVTSPLVTAQLTETHDPAQGNVFGF